MPPFLDNDIAILELEEELDLMEYTPICLAGTNVKESGDQIHGDFRILNEFFLMQVTEL